MMNEDLENIIRYFDGELSQEEERDLLEKIKTDKKLLKEFKFVEDSINAVEHYGDAQLKKEIKSFLIPQ